MLPCLLAPAAHAQFEFLSVEGSTERAVPPICDFGTQYTGESATTHFRLRNTSAAAATLTVLTVAGAGFTMLPPSLPVALAPQASTDFSVVFRAGDPGTYSASLQANGIAVLLTAAVAPRLTYRVDTGVPFPGPLDFGSHGAGATVQRRIAIQNDTNLPLSVPAISVNGADFALCGTAPSGQTLQPRQGGEFTLEFSPLATGARQASLIIGDRTYPMTGIGLDPPLPKPTVSLDLKQAASAQQGVLIVRFDAPAQSSGIGTATLDFRGTPDAAMAFASGGRSATFVIAPGDVQAVLPFQTGTTAGVLTFVVQVGEASDRQSLSIAGAPPAINTAQAARLSGALEVRVAGFDNTRSLAGLTFTFYDAAGVPIPPGAIPSDAGPQAAQYFASSDLGGTFMLRAVFPIAGDASRVASCEATLANSAGSAKTQRIAF